MKKIFTLLFTFCLLSLYAQEEYGIIHLSSGETITTFDGQNAKKVLRKKNGRSQTNSILGHVMMDGSDFFYYNDLGEIVKLKLSEIDRVVLDFTNNDIAEVTIKDVGFATFYAKALVETETITLVPLPIKKKMIRMQQIIAENENYTLSNLFSNGINYFYIYDKEMNLIEKQIMHSATKKKSRKALDLVKEYFSDCTELINRMEENILNKYGKGIQTQYFLLMTIDEDNNATNYITSLKCD